MWTTILERRSSGSLTSLYLQKGFNFSSRKLSLSHDNGDLDRNSSKTEGNFHNKIDTSPEEDLESLLNNVQKSNPFVKKYIKRTKSFAGSI